VQVSAQGSVTPWIPPLTAGDVPAAPTDLDHDGVYEDMNHNSRVDFADVVWLFNHL